MLLSFRDEIIMQKKADTSPTIYKVKTPSGKWKILDNSEMMFNGVGKVTDADTGKVFDPKEYQPISSHDFAVHPPKSKNKEKNANKKYANIYHNYRRNKNEIGEEIVFFSDNEESSSHYGNIHQIFDSEQPNLSMDDGTALQEAMKFYHTTEEEIYDSVYPPRIVESAGVWDDIEFINYLYDINYFNHYDAILTPDGAVVFDNKFIKQATPKNITTAEEISTVEIDQIGFRDTTEQPAVKRRQRKIRNRYTQEEGIDDVGFEGTEKNRNQYKSVINKDDISETKFSESALPLVNFPTSDIVLSCRDVFLKINKFANEQKRDKKIKIKRLTYSLPSNKSTEVGREETYDYPILHDQINMMQER